MTRAAKAGDTIAEFGALVEFSLPGAPGDALRVSMFSTAFTGSFSIHRFSWQFDTSQAMTKAYVPFFRAFGAAFDNAVVARRSARSRDALAGNGCGARGWR
jgi:hypothetical protein